MRCERSSTTPGTHLWDTVPDPVIEEATDAIVQIDATTSAALISTSGGRLPRKPGRSCMSRRLESAASSAGHHLRPGDQVIDVVRPACGRLRGVPRRAGYGSAVGEADGSWAY
ncbi:hypothetical protein GCM10017687_34560 [Streptomyces echinatus]